VLSLVTAPSTPLPSLTVIKEHLRVTHSIEDMDIERKCAAAIQYIERITGLSLISSTWDWFLDTFPSSPVQLPNGPVTSVTSIKYYADTGSDWSTFDAANYQVDVASIPARIALKTGLSWPTDMLRPLNGVAVRFVSGWATWNDVPSDLFDAVMVLTADLYQNRESQVIGTISSRLELVFDHLIANYRYYHT
jgi:uncharacterized phiE125 gp8 family phage protein